MSEKKDLLSILFLESFAYSQIQDIEKLVETNQDLSVIPLQPLYLAIKNTSLEVVVSLLPKLSTEQRKALIQMDVWDKDKLDIDSFSNWAVIYSRCKDDLIIEDFVSSDQFALLLKARFNIQTFDVEDPDYPDHDNYFLTDDSLLLVEFDENCPIVDELKLLIKHLYAMMGVENAYTYLFKIVTDNFSNMEEDEYYQKKENLRDFGFVDYYDAIQLRTHFQNTDQIDKFIDAKKPTSATIDDLGKNQTLHFSSVIPYQGHIDEIQAELLKITGQERLSFLQFNFVRLVNSSLSLDQALKEGSIAINKVGQQTRQFLLLAFDYIKTKKENAECVKNKEGLFFYFDFFDLYKIGASLILVTQQNLKKVLNKSPFCKDEFEYFLGATLNDVCDNAFAEVIKAKNEKNVLVAVENHTQYCKWAKDLKLTEEIIPYALGLFESFSDLKKNSKIHDHFYLNYEVENIDLESILISSFINSALGNFEKSDVNKMGLTISELKSFAHQFLIKEDDLYKIEPTNKKFMTEIEKFCKKFGLEKIEGISSYIMKILGEHLSGYTFDTLLEEDFKHVGGPIILNTAVN